MLLFLCTYWEILCGITLDILQAPFICIYILSRYDCSNSLTLSLVLVKFAIACHLIRAQGKHLMIVSENNLQRQIILI